MGRLSDQHSAARILVYDIETRPGISMHFGYRDEYISPAQVISPTGTMAWSAQWLHEKRVRFMSDHHDGHDAMVAGIYELLAEADIVVGYNHKAFDNAHLDDEFKSAGLPALPPAKQIDLLSVVRKRFKRLPHKKLGYVAEHFGLSAKLSNDGWGLWGACVTDPDTGYPYLGPIPEGGGCAKRWREMRRYAKQDTALTTELYRFLRDGGYITGHPHVGLFGGDRDGCPACGGKMEPAGTHAAASNQYGRLRCTECATWARTARALKATGTGTRAI